MHGPGGGIPVVRGFRESHPHDRGQIGVDLTGEIRGRLLNDRAERLEMTLSTIEPPAGQRFEEADPQREHVAATVEWLGLALLG